MPPKQKQPLTPRQKEVLDWIAESIMTNGVAPSLTQIASEFSIQVANAQRYVSELQAKGHIRKVKGRHFAIQIV